MAPGTRRRRHSGCPGTVALPVRSRGVWGAAAPQHRKLQESAKFCIVRFWTLGVERLAPPDTCPTAFYNK
eukprot:5462302-Alexandrium_andersonii.AAC.1